jgi:hypothetical protein
MTQSTDLFDAIKADVVTLTNRPDLSLETELAVRTATLSAHHSEAFLRDLSTQVIQFTAPVYKASVALSLLSTKYRGLATVQLLDSLYAPLATPEIDIIETGDFFDPVYGTLKTNICYAAGSVFNVNSDTAHYGYLVQFYESPLVRREEYNSWIAMLLPDRITYAAAAIVLATNGNEEKAKNYRDFVTREFQPQLISNFSTNAQR